MHPARPTGGEAPDRSMAEPACHRVRDGRPRSPQYCWIRPDQAPAIQGEPCPRFSAADRRESHQRDRSLVAPTGAEAHGLPSLKPGRLAGTGLGSISQAHVHPAVQGHPNPHPPATQAVGQESSPGIAKQPRGARTPHRPKRTIAWSIGRLFVTSRGGATGANSSSVPRSSA